MPTVSNLSRPMEIGLRVMQMHMDGTLTREAFLAALDEYMQVNTIPDALETFCQYGKEEWVKAYFEGRKKAKASA